VNTSLLTLLNVVADRTPEEILGAMLAATMGGIALVALYRRSRPRVSNPTALLSGLVIAANLGSMLLGAFFIVQAQQQGSALAKDAQGRELDGPFNGYVFDGAPPAHMMPAPMSAAERILAMADQDGDGRTTPEEVALAAPILVAGYDPQGVGSIDVHRLSPAPPFPPDSTRPEPHHMWGNDHPH
jgi:hypothetical protein